MTVAVPGFPSAAPGQFVQLRCDTADGGAAHPVRLVEWPPPGALLAASDELIARDCFLRRPFSIAGLRREQDLARIDIIGRAIGPGTRFVDERRPGDVIDLLGPLGRPFEIAGDASLAILVAGGVGLPPLLWLAEALSGRGLPAVAIVGARAGDLLPLTLLDEPLVNGEPTPCCDEFARHGIGTVITTEDGSRGLRGRTTDALRQTFTALGSARREAVVYTCGPEAMMRAVAMLSAEVGARCRVCLERVMACGMGTCQSCVVPIRDDSLAGRHFELCCTQGPVFDAAQVIW